MINDHHDFLYWWLSLRIRNRCVFLWYLWNALKVAAMETPENICTHTAAQKGAARWWHTLWVGDTKGVTQIGTRPCVTQIGTQRVGDWLQRWRPTHLVYSVAMYNSALMTHSQHYGIDYLTFWNGKKMSTHDVLKFHSFVLLAAPWWDNLVWALGQDLDFSSLPKMVLKQTGLTFTTKTFRWRSQEMYEIGAPPSLVRSLQSQYLICRVKASVYHS